MTLSRLLLSVGLLLSTVVSTPLLAGSPVLAQADAGTSRAAEAAVRAYGGKVLSVDKATSNGRVLYRVKLLLDGGRIKIVTIDSQTGRAV